MDYSGKLTGKYADVSTEGVVKKGVINLRTGIFTFNAVNKARIKGDKVDLKTLKRSWADAYNEDLKSSNSEKSITKFITTLQKKNEDIPGLLKKTPTGDENVKSFYKKFYSELKSTNDQWIAKGEAKLSKIKK